MGIGKKVMHNTKQVAVVSKTGQVLGYVSKQATSIGASKVAKGPVGFEYRNGRWVWESQTHTPRPVDLEV